VVNTAIPDFTGVSERVKVAWKKWRRSVDLKMVDPKIRLKDMDKLGIDMQVLTPSLVHQYTYWADPETSLRMEQHTNNRVAEMVAAAPDRFVGWAGSAAASGHGHSRNAPLHGRAEAAGIEVCSHAEPMELGDPKLQRSGQRRKAGRRDLSASGRHRPAPLKIPVVEQRRPAARGGARDVLAVLRRVLDAHPKLKICVAHGGGYLPFYAGRVDRNYFAKGFTRTNMTKSPSEYLRAHFWYDSCVYNVDMLEFLVRKVGASRIVLGSDYPVGEADPIGLVRRARGLSAADREDILGRTAAKLLGLSI
jgi:aminocarboxymuconate-semialdehyde decarboxylase